MNTIIQYIHRPNNTELGKGNTHECYLFVTSKIHEQIKELIPIGLEVEFNDLTSSNVWLLKAALGSEFRINQMAGLYREYDIEYGDEVILQKHIVNGETKLYAGTRKTNAVGLVKFKKGEYEIANINKYPEIRDGIEIDVVHYGEKRKLKIQFLQSKKKRSDSPILTDIYQIYLDDSFLSDSMLLYMLEDGVQIVDYNKYEYHKITWEE